MMSLLCSAEECEGDREDKRGSGIKSIVYKRSFWKLQLGWVWGRMMDQETEVSRQYELRQVLGPQKEKDNYTWKMGQVSNYGG